MAADFLNGNPNRKQKIRFYILSVKHKALNVGSQAQPGLPQTWLLVLVVQIPRHFKTRMPWLSPGLTGYVFFVDLRFRKYPKPKNPLIFLYSL